MSARISLAPFVPPGARCALAALLVLGATLTACGTKPAEGTQESVFALRTGQCLRPPAHVTAQLSKVTVVACTQPHPEQVFAVVADHVGGTYPGTATLQNFANGACVQQFAPFVGIDYQDSSLFFTYLMPSVRSWSTGDRQVVCVLTTTGQQLTRSLKGAKE